MTRHTSFLRARTEILHAVLSFCTTYSYEHAGEQRKGPGLYGFAEDRPEHPAQIGDLIILKSARPTKWSIGWLMEIEPRESRFSTRYLIKSLDDGELCWWCNAGVTFADRKMLSPKWRWSDAQFAFNDRWLKAFSLAKGWARPTIPAFGEGWTVTLGAREEFNADDGLVQKTVEDWRKLKLTDLARIATELIEARSKLGITG